jgi:hypothetical protein
MSRLDSPSAAILGDLEFLRRQLIPTLQLSATAPLAGGPELLASAFDQAREGVVWLISPCG